VDGADQQRTPRERPRADVHVRRRAGMPVHDTAVMMHVSRTGRTLPRGRVDRAQAERDQHEGDEQLEQV
jgi:hypothetical protein